MDQQNNQQIAKRVSMTTIIVNIVLAVVKLIAGFIAHSGAMISDGIHSASDVLSTVVVMAGLRLSAQAEDKEHPYGHDRMECVAAIILAIVLGITGVSIGWSGVKKIIDGSDAAIAVPGILALVVAVISIIVKEWMYWYTRSAAKKINSSALMADAWHHRSDALSSIGALIGIAGARLGYPVLDAVAEVVIAFMVIKVAFDISKDSLYKMTDRSIDESTIEEIRSVILSYPEVCRIDDLRSRQFGSSFYLDLEIALDGDLLLKDAHAIAEKIHDTLENSYPQLKHCMIHVNPS